jgi:tRNA pseudouridine55 synthase
MHGALLIDKPCGPTSHDVVAFVRRTLKTPRVGHTGTLDPLATGLLVLLVGHATRLSQFLVTDEKEYVADVRLGLATPTYDAQGLDSKDGGPRPEVGVTPEQVRAVLPDFLGTFPQLPPPFSAKKVAGVRAYEKARKNEIVDLKPVAVTVRELELLEPPPPPSVLHPPPSDLRPPSSDLHPPSSDLRPPSSDPTLLRLRVVCSAGFYVRSLAHDIGKVLGCGAHLEALRRTRAGRFVVEDAVTLEALDARGVASADQLVPLRALLPDMPAVTLTEEGMRRAGHGNSLAPHHLAGPVAAARTSGPVCLLDAAGGVLAIADARADGLLHPLVVLR